MISAKEASIRSSKNLYVSDYFDSMEIESRIKKATDEHSRNITITMPDTQTGLAPHVIVELLDAGFDVTYYPISLTYVISW